MVTGLEPQLQQPMAVALQFGAGALRQTGEHNALLTQLRMDVHAIRGIAVTLARQNAALAHSFSIHLARKQRHRLAAQAMAAQANAMAIQINALGYPLPEVQDAGLYDVPSDSDDSESLSSSSDEDVAEAPWVDVDAPPGAGAGAAGGAPPGHGAAA